MKTVSFLDIFIGIVHMKSLATTIASLVLMTNIAWSEPSVRLLSERHRTEWNWIEYRISVTNTTSADVKNNSAGYGINNIDIGAPGTSIYSTVPNNGYSNKTGTSMATPQVTGTIALMYAAMPEEMMLACKNDPASFCLSVRESLLDGADHLSSLEGLVADARRLNAYGAIEKMLSEPILPVLAGEVKIEGEPVVGETLSAITNLYSMPPIHDLGELSFQWRYDTINIEGAIDPYYTLTESDVDEMINVQVSTANCSGTVTSPNVGPVVRYDGIDEKSSVLFKVYPNPTRGNATVQGKGQLVVTNVLGQTFLTREIDGQTCVELPRGLYFVTMNGMTQKIVVE